jgi:hypothetical protein
LICKPLNLFTVSHQVIADGESSSESVCRALEASSCEDGPHHTGELKAKPSQIDRLQGLLEAYDAWTVADCELKQGMIGLLSQKTARTRSWQT